MRPSVEAVLLGAAPFRTPGPPPASGLPCLLCPALPFHAVALFNCFPVLTAAFSCPSLPHDCPDMPF